MIATVNDLGAVPSLFGKPHDYATFLGQELRFYYGGPLLVVMPSGLGVYDAGRSTVAEDKVIAGLTVEGGSADDLTSSAAHAVRALTTAGALVSKDITPPVRGHRHTTTVKRGTRATLRFAIADDSKKATRPHPHLLRRPENRELQLPVPGGRAWPVAHGHLGRPAFAATWNGPGLPGRRRPHRRPRPHLLRARDGRLGREEADESGRTGRNAPAATACRSRRRADRSSSARRWGNCSRRLGRADGCSGPGLVVCAESLPRAPGRHPVVDRSPFPHERRCLGRRKLARPKRRAARGARSRPTGDRLPQPARGTLDTRP